MPRQSSMKSLFCISPQVPADIIDTMYPPIKKTKRASLSIASVTFLSLKSSLSLSPKAEKRNVTKITVGKPSDFRHQVHVGPDTLHEMNLPQVWSIDSWSNSDGESVMSSPVTTPQCTPFRPSRSTSSSRPQTAQSTTSTMTPSPSLPHSPKRKPVPSVIPEGARSFFAPVNILPLSLILPMDGPSASSNKNTPESDKVTSGDVPGPIPELPVSVDVPHDTATSGTPSLPPISVEDVFTDCTTTKPEEVRRTEGEENASEEGQVPSADAIDGDKTEEEVAQS